MKNIRIPKRVGNTIVRHAYIELIEESVRKITRYSGLSHIDLDGYENDNDRVRFTYGGKRCVLYGVWIPSLDNDMLPLSVFATNDGVTARWDIVTLAKDFRFKTLDRIAYEVYDYCKREDDPDYEDAIREKIAGGMDNYREFMS